MNCEPSLASCAARYAASEEQQIYVFDEGDDNKVTAARLADDSFRSAKPYPAESQHRRVLVGLVWVDSEVVHGLSPLRLRRGGRVLNVFCR